MIESPADMVEASKCALDRMGNEDKTGCERSSDGCRWCSHPVRLLLKAVKGYLEDPSNSVRISNYQKGIIL